MQPPIFNIVSDRRGTVTRCFVFPVAETDLWLVIPGDYEPSLSTARTMTDLILMFRRSYCVVKHRDCRGTKHRRTILVRRTIPSQRQRRRRRSGSHAAEWPGSEPVLRPTQWISQDYGLLMTRSALSGLPTFSQSSTLRDPGSVY